MTWIVLAVALGLLVLTRLPTVVSLLGATAIGAALVLGPLHLG